MSPDLKSLMQRSAPEPSRAVDIDAVGRRSRRLRRRDQLISLTTTLALGLAVFLFFSFAQPNDQPSDQENDRHQVVNPGPEEDGSETSLDDRAATFAIRAVADAGLHDPTDIYFDYIDLDKTSPQGDAEDTWIATFSGPECKNFTTRKCVVIDGMPPHLKIESDGNNFTVTGTEGALSKWSEQLVGITHSTDFGPPRYVYDFYDVSNQIRGPVGNDYLIADAYWTGPIPGMFTSNCRLLTTQAGEVAIRVLEEFADYDPGSEGDRDKLVEFGSQERIDLDPATALVNCSQWENLNPPPYEMPPVPEGLELVEVGPEVVVPTESEVGDTFINTEKDDFKKGTVPEGPQYVVARGAFNEGDWGEKQGEEWWLLGWGNPSQDCMTFAEGELRGDEGLACTSHDSESLRHPEALGGRFGPGATKADVMMTYGAISEEVSILEFRLTNGMMVRTEPIEPPVELDVPVNYFVTFLPKAENGYIVALNSEGEELQERRLCHYGCIDEDGDSSN